MIEVQDMNVADKRKKEQQLQTIIDDMPVFILDYFRRIMRLAINTRIQYAYDLKLFFSYLMDSVDEFKGKNLKDLTYDDLNKITLEDIDFYLEYITYYETDVPVKNKEEKRTVQRQNGEYGLNRKMACLKSFFSNLYKIALSKDKDDPNKLEKNLSPLIKLEQPKFKEKYRMSQEAIEGFLSAIKYGEGNEGKFNDTHYKYIKQNTLVRDLCIIALLAETGMRISELVNIDMDHIDFRNKQIKITRKGGKEELLFYNFSEEFLRDYYKMRKEIVPKQSNEKALFLSLQRKRITTRAVQLMIDKYAEIQTNKKISPHTFRRSFATNVYEDTRDVYLVAALIGDTVGVTTKHYTKLREDLKRDAVNSYLKGKIDLDK